MAQREKRQILNAMIDGVKLVDLDSIEPVIRELRGYKPDERLDAQSLNLLAVLRVLIMLSSLHLPALTVEGLRADAREMLDNADLDLAVV